ncbi:ATP-binding protein [Parapedobacter sp. DT-150]|uniref:ATP-binding protein n=1 Tax=Parapedobacter sp. DT-150 TaxID=3396162 RepID=UPI003F1B1D1C
MLRQEELQVIIDEQQLSFHQKRDLTPREAMDHIPVEPHFATIITGIRRCGKSTLLLQLLKAKYSDALYLNFEDIRLIAFEAGDFTRLKQEIDRRAIRILFFDEIQLASHWEVFVNQLLREGYTVFVTGSNASLLSKELGTHLTGRHLSMELFPFSYREFLHFKQLQPGADSLQAYLGAGGMPEYLHSGNSLVLGNLLDDILVRDIAVRHAVRDVASLKQLTIYLLSNVGALASANKFAGLFGIKSSTTILEYFNYLADAYLMEFVPQFDYSIKAQARNPKKIYAIDNGLVDAASTSSTRNFGRRLENMVYLHLRRWYSEIYYFKEKGECDFVVFEKGQIQHAIQVCYHVESTNFAREYDGLIQALHYFKVDRGVIVTADQSDQFEAEGKRIDMVPAYRYFNQSLH